MERLIQYLDILEDAYYVVALLAERIRRIAKHLLILATALLIGTLGIILAWTLPREGAVATRAGCDDFADSWEARPTFESTPTKHGAPPKPWRGSNRS